MRFSAKLFIIFVAVTFLFNSCKNDLNILAPYKETVSVYAILDATQPRQWVRINKIYLGEGNAYTMATVNDSVNYKQGVLKVSLTRTFNGASALTTVGNSTKMEIVLNDTVVQLQSNSPFNSNQRLWFTNDRLFPYGEYNLKIENTQTGNVFTSKAGMIDSILMPGVIQPLGSPYYPVPYSPSNPAYYYLDLSVVTTARKIKFFTIPNGRDYACLMRLNYIDSTTTGNFTRKLDYVFPSQSSLSLDGGEEMNFNYTSRDFFNYMYSELMKNTPSNLLCRKMINIDFQVTTGTQDYSDFLKISAPSTSVAQDKPAYTNIEGGGYGIFACKSTYYKRKHLANATIDYVASHAPYCDLLFLKSDNTKYSGTCLP